jgi:hypothetical protein
MPEIKSRIGSMLTRYESEVFELGEPLEETPEARVSSNDGSKRDCGFLRGGSKGHVVNNDCTMMILGQYDFEYYYGVLSRFSYYD